MFFEGRPRKAYPGCHSLGGGLLRYSVIAAVQGDYQRLRLVAPVSPPSKFEVVITKVSRTVPSPTVFFETISIAQDRSNSLNNDFISRSENATTPPTFSPKPKGATLNYSILSAKAKALVSCKISPNHQGRISRFGGSYHLGHRDSRPEERRPDFTDDARSPRDNQVQDQEALRPPRIQMIQIPRRGRLRQTGTESALDHT